MRAVDLDPKELIAFDPAAGEIRVAAERAVLIDATAMGVLRKDLVEQIGVEATRVLLTRFGFVQGWTMAEATHAEFQWESEEERLKAGGRLHMLEGMFKIDPDDPGPLSQEGSTVIASFEAEQHLAHLGRSDTTNCWMLCGLLSGYLSHVLEKEIFVLEDRCISKGDPVCSFRGRTRQEWGDERAPELRYFQRERLREVLDASLHHVTTSLEQVEAKLRAKRRLLEQVEAVHDDDAHGMVAKSEVMRRLIDLARRVAQVDSTVLITGESGTGKERIARLVHDVSARAAGPFIAINCGAITETLLESELFGHARGAFTGAVQHRAGLFEAANGGTILLDEVGEVSPGMQVKLLRALQLHEVRRVGENRSRPFDVRVIAATNSDLTGEIAAGRFRKDLYYRLNVVELRVPPLRERREDILPLARLLLADAAERLRRPVSGLSPRAADQLLRYSWPGNVRELQNAMERAVALASDARTDLLDLPEEVRQAGPSSLAAIPDGVKNLEEVEKEYILAVLKLNDGNQARTAQMLEIGTATLYRKLKKYGALRGQDPSDVTPGS